MLQSLIRSGADISERYLGDVNTGKYDRAMIESEFAALWAKQAEFNSTVFSDAARDTLKDTLLFQRPLKPVDPGRCTFYPDEKRAPIALPSVQRFRIYQDVNHLRLLDSTLKEKALSLENRDKLVGALEKNQKRSFDQIRKLLGLSGTDKFSIEDEKRREIAGNHTAAILSKPDLFGPAWSEFSVEVQDEIVLQLLQEENEAQLVAWLEANAGVNTQRAKSIANVALPEGFGSLSRIAVRKILPALQAVVCTYDRAVQAAGFEHHSMLESADSGEVLSELPYYGIPLQRHVGFATNKVEDWDEKRYGRIANPTVHIALNQVRLLVNELIKRYGHPSEVIIGLAREARPQQCFHFDRLRNAFSYA